MTGSCWGESAPREQIAQLYESDRVLIENLADFIALD
jgi:hypothetical protein